MTETVTPPGTREFEITLLGPGYGESIILHIGDGAWVLIDSCIAPDGTPGALRYLESIGLDPAQVVVLIVATHWHDDHIRGMTRLVEICSSANFCCASVLCRKEFLAAVHALDSRRLSVTGSGLREIHSVFSRLVQVGSKPTFALANRRILSHGACEIWSLSPNDAAYLDFLRSISSLVPSEGQAKTRIPSLSPNKVAVSLWAEIDDVAVLLGSDLDKQGWIEILQSAERPTRKASMFKVPHHGSESVYERGVWMRMLDPDPFAVLTPWCRGGRALPSQRDVQRILSDTTNAYATARIDLSSGARSNRNSMVKRTVRESGAKFRRHAMSTSGVRLRRPIGSRKQWTVQTFGSACHVKELVQQ